MIAVEYEAKGSMSWKVLMKAKKSEWAGYITLKSENKVNFKTQRHSYKWSQLCSFRQSLRSLKRWSIISVCFGFYKPYKHYNQS